MASIGALTLVVLFVGADGVFVGEQRSAEVVAAADADSATRPVAVTCETAGGRLSLRLARDRRGHLRGRLLLTDLPRGTDVRAQIRGVTIRLRGDFHGALLRGTHPLACLLGDSAGEGRACTGAHGFLQGVGELVTGSCAAWALGSVGVGVGETAR